MIYIYMNLECENEGHNRFSFRGSQPSVNLMGVYGFGWQEKRKVSEAKFIISRRLY